MQPLRQMMEAGILRLMLLHYLLIMLLHLVSAGRHPGCYRRDVADDLLQTLTHGIDGQEQLARFQRLTTRRRRAGDQIARRDLCQLGVGRQIAALLERAERMLVDAAELLIGLFDFAKPGIVELLLESLHRHHKKCVDIIGCQPFQLLLQPASQQHEALCQRAIAFRLIGSKQLLRLLQ
ncbi:hypothetical protein COLO4_02648 [Corchorus olitorius]|uniref:Secreted protein n=1 Tax=Corchorus olitorius TaxID=93759 RepID=A0A1R3L0M0_9ROSI|nr:hypothetical protein COLO4_02648 [Corchorus olitorius]